MPELCAKDMTDDRWPRPAAERTARGEERDLRGWMATPQLAFSSSLSSLLLPKMTDAQPEGKDKLRE